MPKINIFHENGVSFKSKSYKTELNDGLGSSDLNRWYYNDRYIIPSDAVFEGI